MAGRRADRRSCRPCTRHAATPGTGYADLRKGVSQAGQIYLVTFTTCARRRLFEDPDCAHIAAHALIDPRLWRHSTLLAWVLMPGHWHGLIQLGAADTRSARVQKLKSSIARQVRSDCPGMETVWENGFHDRALRAEHALF
ncbi:MAG: transposase [Pseudoxanthomonas sp.]